MATQVKKALTSIGKELQKIRIDHDLTRKDMAEKLKISERELALIEYGKQTVSGALIRSIVRNFFEEGDEQEAAFKKLFDAQKKSVPSVTFNMLDLDDEQKTAVLELLCKVEEQIEKRREVEKEFEKSLREEKKAKRAERKASSVGGKEPKPVLVEEEPVVEKPVKPERKVAPKEDTVVKKAESAPVKEKSQPVDDIDEMDDILAELGL